MESRTITGCPVISASENQIVNSLFLGFGWLLLFLLAHFGQRQLILDFVAKTYIYQLRFVFTLLP